MIFLGFTGCVTDGFNAIKPVLVSKGTFANLCGNETVVSGNATCPAQELRLNLIYLVGVNTNLILYFVIGILIDNVWRRLVILIGTVLLSGGSILFGFSDSVYFDLFIPAYILMGMGGNILYVVGLSFVSETEKFQGMINGSASSMYALSSLVFLIFSIVASQVFLGWIFLSYGCFVLICGIILALIVPNRQLESKGFWKNFWIPWKYLLNIDLIFFSFGFSTQYLYNAFYFATLTDQLTWLSRGSGRPLLWAEVFSVLLPIVGVGGSLILGPICDHISHFKMYALHIVLTILSTLFGSLPDQLWIQSLTFVFFLIRNSLTFIIWSSLCFKVYPSEFSSRIFTLVMSIAGLVGFFAYLLNWIVFQWLNGNFGPINLLLCIMSCIGTILMMARLK